MKLKLKVNGRTSSVELAALSVLFNAMAGGRSSFAPVEVGHFEGVTIVTSPPTDAAELIEPEAPVVVPPVVEQEAQKRRRRTKEEITAEKATEEPAGPFYWSHPESDCVGYVATRNELDRTLASDPGVVEITKQEFDDFNTKREERLAGEAGNVQAQAANDQPATTQTAPETTTGAQAAAATAAPSDEGGKTYTAADVQQLATVVARTHGADKVKDKIAELGGTRIADLTEQQVNELGKFLSEVK